MPIIPSFPRSLTDEHHAWHAPEDHPGLPTRVHVPPSAGSGLEFLTFHRNFVAEFHAWYDGQPFADPAAVAPWTAIPQELKNNVLWDSQSADEEDRIVNNPSSFASADELGTFIEQGIHGFLHNASRAVYNEPVLATFHSPLSTYFYRIHGLVDYWWRRWEQSRPPQWRRFEIAPGSSASQNGAITAVSRIPTSMETWWIGTNGSVQDAYWYEGMKRWGRLEVAPAGSASPNGGIAAVSRVPSSMEIFWIGANGSVQDAFWYEGMSSWGRLEIAPAGSASPNGGIAAVSRIPNSLEISWVGANGSVQDAFWYEGMSRWGRLEIAPAGSASPERRHRRSSRASPAA